MPALTEPAADRPSRTNERRTDSGTAWSGALDAAPPRRAPPPTGSQRLQDILPVVCAQRDDPLPRAARTGAIFRRRLGDARRLPGAGRDAARARPVGAHARSVGARIPTQNADGDWPQWFMFFERERDIRPGDSHGDIIFWPLLALANT